MGGAGIEDHFSDGRFHDVMVRVTGNVTFQLQAVFLTSFSAHGPALPIGHGALARYFPAQPDPGATQTAVLQVIPGGFQSAPQAIRERIDNTRERLDIRNPYLTDTDMLDRILAAARRGVRVRIVTSERSNNWLTAASLKHHYGDLIEAGVEIWEYPNFVAHGKIIIADDWVQFGTINLDAWALYRNFEIAILARSARAVELFEARVSEPDIARSKRGVPSSPLNGRFGRWLWNYGTASGAAARRGARSPTFRFGAGRRSGDRRGPSSRIELASLPLRCHCDGRSGALEGAQRVCDGPSGVSSDRCAQSGF